jgi:RND family efflux transporter MFP subunit
LIVIDSEEFKLRVAQTEAQLKQVRAAIGLQAGVPLSSLDPLNSPPVRETKAVLDETTQQVSRLKTLYRQSAVVEADMEQAESALRVAEARYRSALNSVREKMALVDVQTAQLELAKRELSETTILAPFAGKVQRRLAAVGSFVQAGQPLLELVRTDVLRYRATVPERYAQRLAIGQTVNVVLANENQQVRVTRISPALDTVTRSLTFEADVDNSSQRLRGGLFAAGELVLDNQSEATVIPTSSVLRFAGVDKVWRVNQGKVTEAVVQLGRQTGERVEVIEGVARGDTILLDAKRGQPGKYVQRESTEDERQAVVDKSTSTDR